MELKTSNIQPEAYEIIEQIDAEKLERIAFILKAIAHPLRIRIIGQLVKNQKMCVNDLCESLQSEQSLTSHHLSNMKLSGIIGSERMGKNIFYFIKLEEVITVLRCMNKCEAL